MSSTELRPMPVTTDEHNDGDVTSAAASAASAASPTPADDATTSNVQSDSTEDFRIYKPQNYHRLAEIMSKGKSWGIFRRFDDLNMLHLMALQAEIMELRDLFRDRCRRDDAANLRAEVDLYSGYFHALRNSYSTGDRCSKCSETPSRAYQYSQLGLLTTLRERMSEYNNLLLQVSQLSQAPDPPKNQLLELQDFLCSPSGGRNFLKGSEAFTWKESEPTAYLSVNRAHVENDPFTSFMTYRVALLFHRLCGGRGTKSRKIGKLVDEEAQLRLYSDSTLEKTSHIISVIISSTLPVLTIFVLNSLESTEKRLGLTVLFTAVFGILLAIFSTAKRAEIFAATATFAAVEVVFIGSAITNTGTTGSG
ncbi:hypothetical protein V8F20_002497 [Naviculisporaceae sp. PSN 640]